MLTHHGHCYSRIAYFMDVKIFTVGEVRGRKVNMLLWQFWERRLPRPREWGPPSIIGNYHHQQLGEAVYVPQVGATRNENGHGWYPEKMRMFTPYNCFARPLSKFICCVGQLFRTSYPISNALCPQCCVYSVVVPSILSHVGNIIVSTCAM